MTAVGIVYLAGVVVGYWRGDAPPTQRLALAVLWPLAALACVVTLTILSVSAAILFPVVGIAAMAALAGWWAFG